MKKLVLVLSIKFMTDATQLTPEEIKQYREQFKDYPEALDALDLIEELDGDLIESTNLLVMEAGIEIPTRKADDDNILDRFAEKCRPVVCAKVSKSLIDILSILTGLLGAMGVAVAVLLYILNKFGLENFCRETDNN